MNLYVIIYISTLINLLLKGTYFCGTFKSVSRTLDLFDIYLEFWKNLHIFVKMEERRDVDPSVF